MIEKRPYWQEPGFDNEKSRQINETKLVKFSPLTELPVAISRWGYDYHLDESPIFCTYLFSDETRERFLLSHYSDSPSGQAILNLTIADQNDVECDHYFTLRKVRQNYFVMTHHYSEPEFRYDPGQDVDSEEEPDWEYVATRHGIETYYQPSHIRDSSAREDAIASSAFKDLYLEAELARNKMASELMFDRTFSKVFDHLTERLPLNVKSTSYVPGLKTGKTFDRYYLLDNLSDRELKWGPLYLGPKNDIAKEDIIIFQAMLHNGKYHPVNRSQAVARIQSNGEIHWQSFENKQIFSLEVRDFLQEVMGNEAEVVNREINMEAMMNGPLFSSDVAERLVETHGLTIYDKNSDNGGDLLIIKAEPEALAINFVKMLRNNFGLTHQGIRPVRSPNLLTHHSDRDFQFELSGDADFSFTNSFFEALSDASK